ncbi:uncharacterized protein BP01DRAFT_27658 [Aspergillus saccharolyticus JOP 1030-1]|uniref:Uncharacterized protein n=1 Tax=Aspergillus saccharolyticus JOP 1030-1 TaxID=1450539 RepID=A0A318ZIX0_9EURO|nr:hypothetical protein BP01DRAFT_27658 [Aspergillus saccharolyticus JOP 1030-1]PYH46294.1 hypothetical protein BP01DRAFT_27658 [Aspergillus saccharolyticus JOP 1030-1]
MLPARYRALCADSSNEGKPDETMRQNCTSFKPIAATTNQYFCNSSAEDSNAGGSVAGVRESARRDQHVSCLRGGGAMAVQALLDSGRCCKKEIFPRYMNGPDVRLDAREFSHDSTSQQLSKDDHSTRHSSALFAFNKKPGRSCVLSPILRIRLWPVPQGSARSFQF